METLSGHQQEPSCLKNYWKLWQWNDALDAISKIQVLKIIYLTKEE